MYDTLFENDLPVRNVSATPLLDDGNIDFPPIGDDDGDHHKGCDWSTSYCNQTPTYRVVFSLPNSKERDPDEDPMIFCQKHYAAWLARWVLLHEAETGCPAPPEDHFLYYGKIA